jgi:hypothetical protein
LLREDHRSSRREARERDGKRHQNQRGSDHSVAGPEAASANIRRRANGLRQEMRLNNEGVVIALTQLVRSSFVSSLPRKGGGNADVFAAAVAKSSTKKIASLIALITAA